MKYVLDTHCHTISSGHAYSSLTENIKYAQKIGLKLLAITDHAPKMPGAAEMLYFLNLDIIPNKFNELEILKGVELNILDEQGNIDLPKKILEKLDIRIASLHPPCIEPMDIEKNTNAIICAMKNEFINIIGHLGDTRYPIYIPEIVDMAKKTNTLIELNNASLNPKNTRAGGSEIILEILKECKKQGARIVLGSDAHYHTYIGNFDYSINLLKKCDFPDELIVNTSVEKLKSFLN